MKIDYQLPPIELLDAPVVSVGESQPSIEANQGKPQAKISIRSIMESKEWNATDIGIPVILGEDRSGKPVVVDLSRAPHLLIAGATGSGKSLFIHSLIMSLLFRFTPDELNLLMVDPKTVEFTRYSSLPHLISPIITDVDKTPAALHLLVEEMERRYRLFSKVGSINISEFNSRKKLAVTELDDEGKEIPYKIPKIVIIINELADIMVSDARCKVEMSIARIAQKGRAAGIHMIIATQTPSVQVITDIIKSNIPARIAFRVSSKVDSLNILGRDGAEDLTGRGDMLLMATDSSDFRRIQGAWVSEKEIEKVVKFISRQTSEKVVEIRDFDLEISNTQYWITYKVGENRRCYTIIMTPYSLLKLFEIEGIKIEPDTMNSSEPIHFSKAVLLRDYQTRVGELRGEENDDLTAQECWVKPQNNVE